MRVCAKCRGVLRTFVGTSPICSDFITLPIEQYSVDTVYAGQVLHRLVEGHVGTRSTARAEIDPVRIERRNGTELFRDDQRRMVRQHDATGADPNRLRGEVKTSWRASQNGLFSPTNRANKYKQVFPS